MEISLILSIFSHLQSNKGDEPVLLTVISAGGLPVNVVPTVEADEFYTVALKDGSLLVGLKCL